MGKGVYANSGLCLTCRRYSPKSLGNCKIVKDARMPWSIALSIWKE
jgi:hypothetical protein